MYIRNFEIEGIKCFGKPVEFDFTDAAGDVKKWNVIVGENGTGKSTLLRAIAISLVDPALANRLQHPEGWVRTSLDTGKLEAEVVSGRADRLTDEDGPHIEDYEISIVITGDTGVKVRGVFHDRPTIVFDGSPEQLNDLRRGPWSRKPAGWFSAGYGPFRRLGGDSAQSRQLESSEEEGARFVTLFREDAALGYLDGWLRGLDYRSKEESETGRRARRILEVIDDVTKHLLPEGVRLKRITPDGVFFRTPFSTETPMLALSDGYRGMLALAVDVLRGLSETFEHSEDWVDLSSGRVVAEGVVLVDELDAHLHPSWQREIGPWLQKAFPGLQFIVATHSPFVAMAADPDAIFILDRAAPDADYVVISDAPSSVTGWSAEQVLNILFDVSGFYPPADFHRQQYDRLRALAASRSLTTDEAAALQESSEWLDRHLSAPGNTLAEMEEYSEKQRRADDLAQRLKERDADA